MVSCSIKIFFVFVLTINYSRGILFFFFFFSLFFPLQGTNVLKDTVLPLQVALDSALTAVKLSSSSFPEDSADSADSAAPTAAVQPSTMSIRLKPFPHPDLPFKRDAMQQYGE